jgi:hypothetical protein
MWERRIVGLAFAAATCSMALVGQVSDGRAQVQGLDTPNRAGCPGGYVEGLGCSDQRPVGPGIQDSDQGWQRDWRDFGAGDPGVSIFYGAGGMPPRRPSQFGPRLRN